MFGLVALLFLIVPVAELFVIVQVAGAAGVLNTISLLVLVSIAGTLLIRWQGIELARRLMATIGQAASCRLSSRVPPSRGRTPSMGK